MSAFTTVAAPMITSATPDHGPAGTSVIIIGENFDSTAPTFNVVKFPDADAVVALATATQIETSVPFDARVGAGTVTVTTRGGTSTAAFTVENPVPILLSLSPGSAVAGSGDFALTLHGGNFLPFSSVNFGNTILTPVFINADQLQVMVPASALTIDGTIPVTVTNPGPGGGTSEARTFTITAPAGLSVEITQPSDGDTLTDTAVMVTGTVTSGEAVGVTVNGQVAEVRGDRFAAGPITLASGAEALTAIATDRHGNTATDSVTVTVPETFPEGVVRLSANPAGGTAPLSFSLSISADLPDPIGMAAVDFEGDGTVDWAAPVLTDLPAVILDQPGIYYPQVTIYDIRGEPHAQTTAVVVYDPAEIEAQLQALWNEMIAALSSGDIETALGYFTVPAQEHYRLTFAQLQIKLPGLLSTIEAFHLLNAAEGLANAEVIRTRNGTTYSYPVTWVKDRQGLWKIQAF